MIEGGIGRETERKEQEEGRKRMRDGSQEREELNRAQVKTWVPSFNMSFVVDRKAELRFGFSDEARDPCGMAGGG